MPCNAITVLCLTDRCFGHASRKSPGEEQDPGPGVSEAGGGAPRRVGQNGNDNNGNGNVDQKVDAWRNFGHAVSKMAKYGIVRRRQATC